MIEIKQLNVAYTIIHRVSREVLVFVWNSALGEEFNIWF